MNSQMSLGHICISSLLFLLLASSMGPGIWQLLEIQNQMKG